MPVNQNRSSSTKKGNKGDPYKIFPQKLMEMLNDPTNEDCVTWLPHGKAFMIIDSDKFSQDVLPKYFRKTKFASFTRKLNRWNFSRVAYGPEMGAYKHEFFQRDNEALCIQMYCKNDHFKFATNAPTFKRKSNDVSSSDIISSPLPLPRGNANNDWAEQLSTPRRLSQLSQTSSGRISPPPSAVTAQYLSTLPLQQEFMPMTGRSILPSAELLVAPPSSRMNNDPTLMNIPALVSSTQHSRMRHKLLKETFMDSFQNNNNSNDDLLLRHHYLQQQKAAVAAEDYHLVPKDDSLLKLRLRSLRLNRELQLQRQRTSSQRQNLQALLSPPPALAA